MQVPHMHMEAAKNQIIAHQLDTKPCTPIKLHTLQAELTLGWVLLVVSNVSDFVNTCIQCN